MTVLFTLTVGCLTLLALVMTLWPLLKRGADDVADAADFDIAVYKSQLAEIEKDVERGALSKSDGDAARLEISRRVLKTDQNRLAAGQKGKAGLLLTSSRFLIIILIPAVSLSLYSFLGEPGLQDMPLVSRDAEIQAIAERANQPAAAMDQALGSLAERLTENPDDLEGWMLMARSLMAQQRYGAAVSAFRRAIALNKDDPNLHSGLGEAMTMEADGQVTEDAVDAFRTARALDDADIRTKFYLAQYHYQQGRPERAIVDLQTMAKLATPETEWLPSVIGALVSIAVEQGHPEAHYLADLPLPEQPTGPDMAAVNAAETAMSEMSDEERTAMIQDMVSGLAARLAQDPNDIEGWFRLIRSYATLGDEIAADQAYAQARETFPENETLIIQYARIKRELAGTIQTDQTIEMMREVLAINPQEFEANWFAGLWAFKQGDRARAKEHFDIVLGQVEPGSALYKEITGQLSILLGDEGS